MFEARLLQGSLLKKVIEAIKELVTDANFDCTESEFGLQAMDSSHVSLVALKLEKDGFEHFRCDKPISMGVSSVPDVWMLGLTAPEGLTCSYLQASTSRGCQRS
jgi:proliferating cell nuclear antigen PCNA